MILAFDIGALRIKAARGGVALGEVPTPLHDAQAFVEALHGFVQGDEAGVAIALAGHVDPDSGRVRIGAIPCINGRALARELQGALGLPVVAVKDADCLALAETAVGTARGHRNVLALILGEGLAGGLVIDGRLVQGEGGYAGDWGHGPVIRSPLFDCACGLKGCLETVASARGIERLHHHLTGQAIGSVEVIRRWRAGEPSPAVTLWLDLVSAQLAMVLNVVGASIVPVGGGLANDRALIAALDRAVRARLLRKADRPLVVVAQSGAEAFLIGAAIAFGGGQTQT
ncbi:ROK family protein [bacterium]|nr:ROK family protein [bacterium]